MGDSPQIGFNNDVRYRGRRFHIQTEDFGVDRPHIITHLFADGGHIIRSLRTDYSQHLGRADLGRFIHELMRTQHRAMALALRGGQLDATLDALPQEEPRPASEAGAAPALVAGGAAGAGERARSASPPALPSSPEPDPAPALSELPTDPSRLDASALRVDPRAPAAWAASSPTTLLACSLDELILRQLLASSNADGGNGR